MDLRWLTAWGAVALGLASAPQASAQTPQPLGSEFQVNTYTSSYQANASVARAPDGAFVVVWESYGSYGTDNSGRSIQGQRYAADGTAQGGEFQVNTYTTGLQFGPRVSMDSDGDFVVVWESNGSYGTDTSLRSIQGQRYAADGTAQGGEFQVNTYTTGYQFSPAVSVAPGGDFVVVWSSQGSTGTDSSSYSIQGRRYAANGTAQGGEFQVNTYTTGSQVAAAVAAGDAGFVVGWTSDGSYGTDTGSRSIQGQRYAADGTAQGGEFQVNTYTTQYQYDSSVSAASNGDFVVAWTSYGASGTDIRSRRFASDGTAKGSDFLVNTYSLDYQRTPEVAVAPDGDFVVVWASYGSFGPDDDQLSVQGQSFAADGTPLGLQFQVNTYTTLFQDYPAVVAGDLDFVVVWNSEGSSGDDTSSLSVQAQRMSLLPAVPALPPLALVAATALLALGARALLRRRA